MGKRKLIRWCILLGMSSVLAFFLYREVLRPEIMLRHRTQSEEWRKKALEDSLKHKIRMDVFLGNSITAGLAQYLGAKDSVLVFGINGDFTEGLLKRSAGCVNDSVRGVFIQIGINDILAGFSKKRILKNYHDILLRVKQYVPAYAIHVQSIFPVSFEEGFMSDPEDANKQIKLVNDGIKKLCREEKVHYMDLHPLFLEDGKLRKDYTSDGVHLTDAGYKRWLIELGKFLRGGSR